MGNKRNRNRGNQKMPGGRQFSVPLQGQQVPNAWNPNSLMLRQLGLHTPEGLMRLLTLLVHKHDPEGKGIELTAADIAQAVAISTVQGRQNLQVRGGHDVIVLRMVTDAEAKLGVQADNTIAKAQGRETSPDVDKANQPVQPGRGTPPGFS